MSRYRLRALAVASTSEVLDQPSWLESYDLDAHDGRGLATFTADPGRALTWPSPADAMEVWKAPSVVRPFRPDGNPNRPLSAFTMSVEPVPADEERRR